MTRRRIFARIKRGTFEREEFFWSVADAICWEEMVLETLDLLERVTLLNFDLQAYSAGLAESVRDFGSARTRNAWLTGEATPEEWARGHPVVSEDLAELMLASLRRHQG